MTDFLDPDPPADPLHFDVRPKCAQHCACAVERLQKEPGEMMAEAARIRAQQEIFMKAVDKAISFYRVFHRTPRPALKEIFKSFFEGEFLSVGEAVGVSRMSVDHLWIG